MIPLSLLLCSPLLHAEAQTITADFSNWSIEPPLVKTKFGVYQTPLVQPRSRMLEALDLLREAEPQEFRYEMGWGKNDALDFDQIGGTAQQPTYDFRSIDEIMDKVKAADARLLLSLAYCPNPLKPRGEQGWPRWKDIPSDMEGWKQVTSNYAARAATRIGPYAAWYEIWNEPDMPEPHGKMFFSGSSDDYKNLYSSGANGVRTGAAEAAVGGGALAYDVSFFDKIKETSAPIDFASIHAYANYEPQLNNLRTKVNSGEFRRDPMLLTEYGSYDQFGLDAPVSKAPAAMSFFKDIKGLLRHSDTPIVYWAQWADKGMGMIYWDGSTFRRKAIFNALKIYQTMLPVDRVVVSPDHAEGVNTLAAADPNNAGIVVWNENPTDKDVTVQLSHLPFAKGTLQLFRIDPHNASFCDSAASENLSPEQLPPISSHDATWKGTIPGQSLVFLKATSGVPAGSIQQSMGTFVKSLYWFDNRSQFTGPSPVYADFDRRTWIARLGMGSNERGVAVLGTVIDNPSLKSQIQVRTAGPFSTVNEDSLFGIRIDFQARDGQFTKSVLIHGSLNNDSRSWEFPWGKKGAKADRSYLHPEMKNGGKIAVDLKKIAPADWNGKRVIYTWILQNAGAGSRAIFSIKASQ
jgi:hypothetical protein